MISLYFNSTIFSYYDLSSTEFNLFIFYLFIFFLDTVVAYFVIINEPLHIESYNPKKKKRKKNKIFASKSTILTTLYISNFVLIRSLPY